MPRRPRWKGNRLLAAVVALIGIGITPWAVVSREKVKESP
jgi:hypothetical protein